ncbi:conserved Plasmodium protein, unknown function [Plasmodium gallinaceum]|uniref:Uncharacterized protein n=1 Tax=Plasmodium gallinaceum TaxID=5849 RepID=A0A1J1GMI0_PLAGA|nr:LOW QUALITY PROTEIN: conserved Plasmodium protein, unknown function [Plasmodium gallinaceum]CRG93539.1 conserved Plasmodium protein, unknown function [Plasmodium gallinaceum]
MDKTQCVVCGNTSFRIEEGQYVCNECNYVSEIVVEQFDEAYDLQSVNDDLNNQFLEKDIYNIIKKLYKDDNLSNNIAKYVFKENDEFFINFQKILINFIHTFITVHSLPPIIYDEIKKIWFYILELNIKNLNIYMPFGGMKDSLRYVYEVIKDKKIVEVLENMKNDNNINEELKNVAYKMGLSKISYFFTLQKKYLHKTFKMTEFYPKKSEINKQFNIRLLNLYRKTSLLDSEKKNRQDFIRFNELINSIKQSKTKNEINSNNTNDFFDIDYNEEDILNYEINSNYENNSEILDFISMENLDIPNFEIDKKDNIYEKENNLNNENKSNNYLNVNNNIMKNDSFLDAERVYHFYSSYLINKFLLSRNLSKPIVKNISCYFMNRSTNYNELIGLIYEHDFLYYLHEELKKKCDIEFLSYYDILQVFKGNYDHLLYSSLYEENSDIYNNSNLENNSNSNNNDHKNNISLSSKNEEKSFINNNEFTTNNLELEKNIEISDFQYTTELKIKNEMDDNYDINSLEYDNKHKIDESFEEKIEINNFEYDDDFKIKKELDDIYEINSLQYDNEYKQDMIEFGGNIEASELEYNNELKISNQKENEETNFKEKKVLCDDSNAIQDVLRTYKNYIELNKEVCKKDLSNSSVIAVSSSSDNENENKNMEEKTFHKSITNYNSIDKKLSYQNENLSEYMNDMIDNKIIYDDNYICDSFSCSKNVKENTYVDNENDSTIHIFEDNNRKELKYEKNSNNVLSITSSDNIRRNLNNNDNGDNNNINNNLSNNTIGDNLNSNIKFDIYKKLEYINKIKKKNKYKIERNYYDNGLKNKKENLNSIYSLAKQCIFKNINEQNSHVNVYIPEKYLIDSFVFDDIYKKVLYISNLKRFRTLSIKHIYKEYIEFFFKDYKYYLIDSETYKFCFNFTFDLLFYILYYCLKRLNIYCLPHNMKNYINSDNFNLYKIFNNVSESFFKLFKEQTIFNFPLKNSHFSELKKYFFIRNLKSSIPFICIHNYEHNSKYFMEETDNQNNDYIYKEIYHKKLKLHFSKMKNLNFLVNRKWLKDLENFNGYLIINMYSLINDLIFKFQLPNAIQTYSIKLLNLVIFKYRFSQFLYNVYSNKYDDLHIELNNFYNYKKIYKDCFTFFGGKYRGVPLINDINKYILYLMRKEYYIKKKFIETKKYLMPDKVNVNYKVYNKINYFYRQKFFYTFYNIPSSLYFSKKHFYNIAAGCVIIACKLYYPMFSNDFFCYENMFVKNKYESYHLNNHYKCHIQNNFNFYNKDIIHKCVQIKKITQEKNNKKKKLKKHKKEFLNRNKKEIVINENKDKNDTCDNLLKSKIKYILEAAITRKKKKKIDNEKRICKLRNIKKKRKFLNVWDQKYSSSKYIKTKKLKCSNFNEDNNNNENYVTNEFNFDKIFEIENNTLETSDKYVDIENKKLEVEDKQININEEDNYTNITNLNENYNQSEKKNGNENDKIDSNIREIILNTNVNYICDQSNEIYMNKNIEIESLNERNLSDYYNDILNGNKNESYFDNYLHKSSKYYEENLVFDFLNNDFCDDYIYNCLIIEDYDFENAIKMKSIKKEVKKQKKKKINKIVVKEIHFKSLKYNNNYYFVPSLNILRLFFNCRKHLCCESYKKLIEKNENDVKNEDEENFFRKFIYQKVCADKSKNEYSSDDYEDENKTYVLPINKGLRTSFRNDEEKKMKIIFIKQNPFCCKDLLYDYSSNILITTTNNNTEKFKNILETFFLNSYPHHLSYFNFNLNILMYYNFIELLLNDNNSLLAHLSNKINSHCNVTSKSMIMNKMIRNKARYVMKFLYITETKKKTINNNSILNEENNNDKYKKKNVRKKKNKKLNNVSDNVYTDKQKESNNIEENMLVNFNDDLIVEFIKTIDNYENDKILYKLLNNTSDDSENEKILKNKSEKIWYVNFIYSKNYETAFFTYILYEYYYIVQYYYHYTHLVDILNDLIKHSWNLYQLLFFYYQLNYDIYIYFKCLTQLLNMFEYFFVMIKDKEHINANNFNCFYRNRYIKRKKKILYKIKIFYFIFQILYSINGAKYKTNRNLYFYMCKCFVNTESVIFHRKYFTKIPFKKYFLEMNFHLKNIIKKGHVYLKNILENTFNINTMKRIITSKMKHISKKLGNLIKRTYVNNDYIHSYVLSFRRNMMFHIIILNVNFFLINFKGTIKLVEQNYSTFIENYYRKFYHWDEKNSNNNVIVLSMDKVKKKKKSLLHFSKNLNEKLYNRNITNKVSGEISNYHANIYSFFMKTQKYKILKKKAFADLYFESVNFNSNKNNNIEKSNNKYLKRCNCSYCLLNFFQIIKNNENNLMKKKQFNKNVKFLENVNTKNYVKFKSQNSEKKKYRNIDMISLFHIYINIIFELNKTKKKLPYLFNYNFILSNLINKSKSNFLCLNKSDIINDCIKNIFKQNYEILHNTYLTKILKCESTLNIKKQLNNKHLNNFFSNFNIFKNDYYKIDPKIIKCFLIGFLKFFRKFNRIIRNPNIIFFLYYWRSCSDLINKNKFPINNFFVDQELAENIFYSFFLYFSKIKCAKNELIKNRISIINYNKLFKYILNIENILIKNKDNIVVPNNDIYDKLFYKNQKYSNNKYSLNKKKENTTKLSLKSRLTSLIQNINFSSYIIKNIKILDIYKSFMKLINNLKDKEYKIDFNKIIYFHSNDDIYMNNIYEKMEKNIVNKEKEKNRINKKKKHSLNFYKSISNSIMIDNFINNSKQFFLVKKMKFLEQINNECYKRDITMKDNDSFIYNEDKGISKTLSKKNTLKYILVRFFKRNVFDEFRKNKKEGDYDNFNFNIFYEDDHIHYIILKNYLNSLTHFIEPIDCISIFNTKIYKKLNHLFSNIPINFKTYSYLKQNFNKTLFESIEKIDSLNIKEDILLNNKKDINLINNEIYINDEEGEEFAYISTDLDSYKSDTVYYINLNKMKYADYKKHVKKNKNLLKMATKEKPYCKLNKCFSSVIQTNNNVPLFHDCYKIYTNIFRRLNDYFENSTYLLKILDENIFEWHNNLNMYDTFLFLHNKCYNFRKTVKQRSVTINTDENDLKFENHFKNKNCMNKNNINDTYKNMKMKTSNMYNENSSSSNETKKKSKNENKKEIKIFNNFDSYVMRNICNKNDICTKKNFNFKTTKRKIKEPYVCIYNDSSYFNVTNTCVKAEINKNNKYEELLINYNLNKNVHFEFNSSLNCFILRLKNDYIKKKNRILFSKIKKNQIYKLKFIQNFTYTKKYTYFIFSCFIYSKFLIIRMMYLFSLKYFPSLFLKTANYLNYLKLDEKFLELLYCDDYEILHSIFYNFTSQKNYKTIFDILRFKGYHINPFSLLGSLCYIKEIKIICKCFKLRNVNYFNTLHSVISIDSVKNEVDLINFENFIYKQEMNKKVSSEFNELSKKEKEDNDKESCLNKVNLKKKNRKNDLKLYSDDLLYNNILLVEFTDNLEYNIDNNSIKEFFKRNYNEDDHFNEIKNFESNVDKMEISKKFDINNYFREESEDKDKILEYEEFEIEENQINNDEINERKKTPRLIIPPTLPNISCVLLAEKKKKKEKERNNIYINKSNEEKVEEEKITELHQYVMPKNETNAFNVIELYEKKRKASNLNNKNIKHKKRNIQYTENDSNYNEISMNNNILNNKKNEKWDSEYLNIRNNQMDNNCNINISNINNNIFININENDRDSNNNNSNNNNNNNDMNINNNDMNINNNDMNINNNDMNINNDDININNNDMNNNDNNILVNRIDNNIDIKLNFSYVEKGNQINEKKESYITSNKNFTEKKKKKKKKKKKENSNKIYYECLMENSNEQKIREHSKPSETINLYNIIIKFLNDRVLLKNDSITYEKYRKKNIIEFNHIMYKEFTLHTNYYSESFNKSILNEFISLFYDNNFKNNYLKHKKKYINKIKKNNYKKDAPKKKYKKIDYNNISLDINNNIVNSSYEFNEYSYLNDDKLSSPKNVDKLEKEKKDTIKFQSEDENERENNRENKINKKDIQKKEKININMSIANNFLSYDEGKKYSDKEEYTLNKECDNSSCCTSDYCSSEFSDEYKNEGEYITCSFFLHKPIYIFDERKERKEIKQKEHNEKKNYNNFNNINKKDGRMKDSIFSHNRDIFENYFSKSSKKLRNIYKKLIKKIENDKSIKKTCYKLYDKKNSFLMRDYKCSKHKNIWKNFTKKYVKKKKNINNLFNGDSFIINSISNDIHTYDNEIKNIVRIYKNQKMLIKIMKQKQISQKYKNTFPWIGDNIYISPNNVDKFIIAGYSSVLFHQNTSYLKNFNHHAASVNIPLNFMIESRRLDCLSVMLSLLIKVFSSYIDCTSHDLITACREIEKSFKFFVE